jgi:threonine dehydrogenase-like Zn-dependent dehydrogenase
MTRALWYVAPGEVALRPGNVGTSGTRVTALYSGLSRGTERLVLNGRVPASEHTRMRCPHQDGAFPFPVKYGYSLVGRATDGAYAGQAVFLLHPHQTSTVVPDADLHPLPLGLPRRRAVLTANMETALNVTWDAGIAAGDRVLVVGAGVLGLLVAALVARTPGTDVTVADLNPTRADIVKRLGAGFTTPDAAPRDQDVVIHCSASSAGLATAMDAAGDEATVVEASWYGDAPVAVPLGGAFHARRLKLVSSQVGRIPPMRAPRWSYRRRLATALRLLCDPMFDHLITGEIAFDRAAELVPAALAPDSPGLMTVLKYSNED